jgi:hypothetical protein
MTSQKADFSSCIHSIIFFYFAIIHYTLSENEQQQKQPQNHQPKYSKKKSVACPLVKLLCTISVTEIKNFLKNLLKLCLFLGNFSMQPVVSGRYSIRIQIARVLSNISN